MPMLDYFGYAAGQAIQHGAQAVAVMAEIRGTHEVGEELRGLVRTALLHHLDTFGIEPKIEAQVLIALRGVVDALEGHTDVRKLRPNLQIVPDNEANEDDDQGQGGGDKS